MKTQSNQCPCQSTNPFDRCCGRFLLGANDGVFAKTPVQLMRSRYSAFALGGYGQYLLDTWSVNTRPATPAYELSQKLQQWIGLEIVEHQQKGRRGVVEFKARFIHTASCYP
ncbi:MAG: YchJ family metal-binding protein [Pseudomonadota bacterium]|nr:YchJ family metal-binding protein [Pseudomonadota bacterium]